MKALKKRTCLKCKKTKTEKHYKEMPNGRLNPKCNDCRNNGRQAIDKRQIKKDDLIINNTVNSFEVNQTERYKAISALLKAQEIESNLIKQGKRYVKNGIRAYTLV